MAKIDKRRRSREASQPAAASGSVSRGTGPVWRRHALRLLALWGLVFIAYSNSFQGARVFDNASAIGEDPRIREVAPRNIESILTGGYWYGNGARATNSGLYRPLTTFSYLLNYAVLGDGPSPPGVGHRRETRNSAGTRAW